MHFAEPGASIKIENKRAEAMFASMELANEDPTATVSAYFSSVNWGKEHLFLDLKNAEDRAQFDALLTKADVLITNHMATDSEKLGLTEERIRGINATLLHGHIKGFADQPDRPAFDVVLQAEAGYLSMTGTDEHHIAKLPIAMIAVWRSSLKEACFSLLQRERTGRGSYVDVRWKKPH